MENNLFKGKGEFEKITKNKKWLKQYSPILENEEVINEINDMGIKRVSIFDELGMDFDNEWYETKELTLSILPYCSLISKETDVHKEGSVCKIMATEGLEIRPEHIPSQMFYPDEKEVKVNKIVAYFPKRNIIVALVNPFVNRETFNFFKECVKEVKPKFLDREQIEMEEVAARMMEGFLKKKETLKANIDEYDRNMKQSEDSFKEYFRKKKTALTELEIYSSEKFDLKDHVKEEIMKVKSMPVVKMFEIKKGILNIGFGDVFITSKVRTGKQKKNGVEEAVFEAKKIFIGDLLFKVDANNVKVDNLTYPKDRYQHPHCKNHTCCFGESSTELSKLIINFDLVKLVKLLYSWAFSYNEAGGPYRTIQSFYERDKTKKEIEVSEN